MMNSSSVKEKSGFLRAWLTSGGFLPWLVLLSSLSITYQFGQTERDANVLLLQTDFDFKVRENAANIKQRLRTYEQVLRGAQGLFAASDSVTRDGFRTYVEHQHFDEDYPGIQGVGFSLIVPPGQEGAHIAAIRKELQGKDVPVYAIRPEGIRSLYTSIIYLEPFSGRNLLAFGYDMYSEPVRRAAMEQARDSGKASISGKVRLAQETLKDVQAGFLMYLPVYKNGAPHGTVIERRANIIGWVYEVFRMSDLMRGIHGEAASELGYEIYDGKDVSDKTLMYDSDNAFGNMRKAQFRASTGIDVAGHDWTMLLGSSPAFEKRLGTYMTSLIVQSGIVVSLLLFFVTWQLVTGRARALTLAQKMTRELTRNQQILQQENEKNLALLHNASDGIHILDAEGNLIEVSDSFCDMLGYSREEMLGMNVSRWDAKFTAVEIHPALGKLFAVQQRHQFETRHRRRDGSIFDVEISSIGLTLDGRPVIFNSARDITERKQLSDRLQDERDFMDAILQLAGPLMLVIDRNGAIVRFNRAAEEFTGYSFDEVKGKPFFWRNFLLPEQQPEVEAMFESALSGSIKPYYENFWVARNGEKRIFGWTNTLIFGKDGKASFLITIGNDITERKLAETQIRNLAFYDPLTQLPNRRLFDDRLSQAMAASKRGGRYAALMVLDMDNFKPLNDKYGHVAGDLLLIEVASRLRGCVRELDTVARFGGDEFLVVLGELDVGRTESSVEAGLVAEKIRTRLAEPYLLTLKGDGIADAVVEHHCTASIGVVVFIDHEKSQGDLLKWADAAMYQAKESGRNQIRFHHMNA